MANPSIFVRIADSPLWLVNPKRGRVLVEHALSAGIPQNAKAAELLQVAQQVVAPPQRQCAAVAAEMSTQKIAAHLFKAFPIVCYRQTKRPGTVFFEMSLQAAQNYLHPGAVVLCGENLGRVCLAREADRVTLSAPGQPKVTECEMDVAKVARPGWFGFHVFDEQLLARQ